LPRHPAALAQVRLLDIFWVDSWRFPKLTGTAGGLFIDYSKNLVTAETLGLLFDLGR
jgi:glucose-6-phosphate isomerase